MIGYTAIDDTTLYIKRCPIIDKMNCSHRAIFRLQGTRPGVPQSPIARSTIARATARSLSEPMIRWAAATSAFG